MTPVWQPHTFELFLFQALCTRHFNHTNKLHSLSGRAPLSSHLLREELRPFLLAPRAGDLTGNETIPEDGRRDVDTILSGEFDCMRNDSACITRDMASFCLLVYLKSLVTSTPPFADDLSVRASLNAPTWLSPMTPVAISASFARMSRGVMVEVGISKNSPWRAKSCYITV